MGNSRGIPLSPEERQNIIDDYKKGKGPSRIQRERKRSINTIRKILDEEKLRGGISVEDFEKQGPCPYMKSEAKP